MPGLSRFDFYPRDWHLDTRDLSNAAKGVYIDLLATMYARGGPLPMDEREICRLCGRATTRSLRPLGRVPLYSWRTSLDWATSRLGPLMRSTSEGDRS